MHDINLLGDFIREARSDMDYTLRDLSEKADVSFSQLSKIERGIAQPNIDTLNKIANALNVDKDHMFALAGLMPEHFKIQFIDKIVFDKDDNLKVVSMINEKQNNYFVGEKVNRLDNDKEFLEALCKLISLRDPSMNLDTIHQLAEEMFDFYNVRRIRY